MKTIKDKYSGMSGAARRASVEEKQIEFAKHFISGSPLVPVPGSRGRSDIVGDATDVLSSFLPEGSNFDALLYDALIDSLQTLFGAMGLTPETSVILQGEQAAQAAGLRDDIRTLTRTLATLHEEAEVRRLEQHNQAMEIQEAILKVLMNSANQG